MALALLSQPVNTEAATSVLTMTPELSSVDFSFKFADQHCWEGFEIAVRVRALWWREIRRAAIRLRCWFPLRPFASFAVNGGVAYFFRRRGAFTSESR